MLETERLWLEPLRVAHAAEMFELLSDERIYRFVPHDPPSSLPHVEARFQRLEARTSPIGDEVWLNWIARVKSDGKCVGRVEATLRPDRSAYFAYEISPALWGRGYATEACGRVIAALFQEHRIVRIVAEVDTRNEASIRLLERLGFERGALRRDADFFKGVASDEFTYTLDSSDWRRPS